MNADGGMEGGNVVPLRKDMPGAEVDLAEPPAPEDDRDLPVAEAGRSVTLLPGERRPIVPVPVRRENLKGTVAHFAGTNWHRARYHGLRLPLHVAAVLLWALAGLWKAAAIQVAWWWDTDMADLRSAAVMASDAREVRSIDKNLAERRKFRGGVLLGELAALIIGITWAVKDAPGPDLYAGAGVAAIGLALAGKPSGRMLIAPAVLPPKYEKPTHPIIQEALCELPFPKIRQYVKDHGELEWVSDVHSDGDGWAVELDLPKGVTAKEVIREREALSSSLRRPLSATWPEAVPHEHEGRMYLWIGRHDMSKVPPRPYPLLRTGTSDYFGKVPFAANPRSVPVAVPLFQANILIGAAPGEGKTSAVRTLGLGAALDPVCDLWVHEFSGKGDLRILGQVAHRYCSGLDDEALAYAAESIALLRDELERRSAIFKKLPDRDKPEGALTRELAMDPRLRLRPIVVIFDEVQNLFLSQYGAEAAATLVYIMRLARAYGITIILATQRPDRDCLPPAIGGVVQLRFCLKVPDYIANDMVLGTGAYKAGYNAVLFRHEIDAGLGWLRGAGDPQPIRTHYLNLKDAGKVAARARLMRERAGVLSGYAIGEDEQPEPRDVLADVRVVFGADNGLQWADLAERLAQRWPDRWAGVTAETISAQCRALNVRSVDVKTGGVVLKGCRRVSVDEAARRW
jgi:S-DNA-T family DNA segregation ATPase FtsK/SpoIIIE